ncbi:MAG TPA: sulfotransferase [Steroidobacteraceae bacterium]|nr:sulfotransferase [Steroidobacteraceae bacterium]
MKLPRPFFRLPLRFDAARLAAEAGALPPGAWSRPPRGPDGHAAVRLVSVGGGDNDAVDGEMKPTAALGACPYLAQALASFSTVWSRTRLLRIDGGASLPQHSDVSYHGFHRVRVHLPVVARPEVRFHCAGEDVHMAPGEAWIFDGSRPHRLENPAAEACVHLVADTSGTSAFWRLLAKAESRNFGPSHPDARLVPFDPAARPQLLTERFNAPRLMPPAEVEQLTYDLVHDLAPAEAKPESAAAPGQMAAVMAEFCHDWRSLWSLFADSPDGRAHFEQLLAATRRRIGQLPPVRVASTGGSAQAVLQARIFDHAFADGRRREVPEFEAAPARDEPTLSELPTIEVPRVEMPTVEVPRITTVVLEPEPRPVADTLPVVEAEPVVEPEPEPWRPPVIERPVIILSAPRAGSTLLFETLAQAAGIFTIGGESHQLIESIATLRPGRGVVNSNRLTRRDATTAIVSEIRQRFAGRIHDRDRQPPGSGEVVRLLEKTPKNALRVPFLLEVFPDALFVFLHREPRANLSSMMQAWRGKGWITYRGLPGWPGPWSLLLPPGYERMQGKPLEEIVAFQWRVANETILDDLGPLPKDRWTSVRYEDLVADPRATVERLLAFMGLAMDARLADYLSKPLPPSRHTQSAPDPEKWRQNEPEIERVMEGLAAIAARVRGEAR